MWEHLPVFLPCHPFLLRGVGIKKTSRLYSVFCGGMGTEEIPMVVRVLLRIHNDLQPKITDHISLYGVVVNAQSIEFDLGCQAHQIQILLA